MSQWVVDFIGVGIGLGILSLVACATSAFIKDTFLRT